MGKQEAQFCWFTNIRKHRGQNPFAAVVGLMADPYVDAVYIGDPTISERTMAQFGYYHQTNQFLLEVAPSESRYLKRILGTHTNRLDAARDVLRSELSRTSEMFRKDEIATIESEQTEARPVGTVTIDNENMVAIWEKFKSHLWTCRKMKSQYDYTNY